MPNKLAYFQGGGGINEPTPGKKKYKSDPAITVQPRFKEPFYRNYDLYVVPGMEDIGPGTGWHGLQNYNDVKSFLEDRRKRMKSRYVADDSWQLDNGKRVKARMSLLSKLAKTADHVMMPKEHGGSIYDWKNSPYQGAPKGVSSISQWRKNQDSNDIDFPMDEYTDPAVEVGNDEQADHNTNPLGGFLDDYLPQDDFEGKSPDELDFGRDYDGEFTEPKKKVDNIEELVQMYLDFHAHRPPLEMPDGVQEEEESTEPNDPNGQYGETDSGNTFYDKMWI